VVFENVKKASKDAIFGLNETYRADTRKNKVYLAVGIYMDEHLNKPLMQVVKKAQEQVINQETVANYLPVPGNPAFIEEYGKLLFGQFYEDYKERLSGFQTVGGTSALRMGADFLFQEVSKTVYFPDPTWPNHYPIFERAGFNVEHYPYYSFEANALETTTLVEKLKSIPSKSIILFHTCCHNPTGSDLTEDEWRGLLPIIKEKGHLLFFDFAYMGFNRGVKQDRFPLELFIEAGVSFLVAASCSKSFSLYCQRLGALYVFSSNKKEKEHIDSQIKKIIRASYSNPPAHASYIVAKILKDQKLKEQWIAELDLMRHRIETMRKKFADGLVKKAKHKDFSPIYKHKGMFSYCALSLEEVDQLIKEYGVYTLMQGRVNICGLNDKNIDYVIDSMIKVADK
jgi:aspartate/tyrosine/aromatic aminotransferase